MIRHVLTILAVADLPRSAAFYRAAFPSWKVQVEVPVYVEMAHEAGGWRLGLYDREAYARNTGELPPLPGGITATELYLYTTDVETAARRLEEAGARLLSPRADRPWGDEAAYYADPDGNVVAVARPLDLED